MLDLTVHDDTRRQKDLADRITRTLESVAPLVARTTGLPLPPAVRFRVVTPAVWRRESVAHLQRLLVRDISDLGLHPAHAKQLKRRVRMGGAIVPPMVLPMIMGWTALAADGQREVIVVPQALRHGGLLSHEPSLTKMIAHELTHLVQVAAYDDDPAWNTLVPDLRKTDKEVTSLVLEGHALWTDGQVTTQLYGRPVDQRHRGAQVLALPAPRNRLARTMRLDRARYAEAATFFNDAVAIHGVDQVNRIWQDRPLLPTKDEFTDADARAWIRRIAT
ncbi:zinc-dependent metalloprotease [Streptomyces broussonetiae]|uniref:Zinc-dependent metalloprotease n=1 Tax=Streptomyces broussonetiae TaxID=2686304 RepID=A0ABV5EMA1_9ACTN